MTGAGLPRRPRLRASHEDRDRVAGLLRVAAGDGRLTMEELDERLDKALTARTGSELELLVGDLPAVPVAGPLPPLEAKEHVHVEVASGNAERRGPWMVPRAMSLRAGSGNIKLDLTEGTKVPTPARMPWRPCREYERLSVCTLGAVSYPPGWQGTLTAG